MDVDKSGVNISCVVNGTNLREISIIQLKRSESNVVSVTNVSNVTTKLTWQDKALENKTGVTVNASITNIMTSYLGLEISKKEVRYTEDMGLYQCTLIAIATSGEIKRLHSKSIMLNITGNRNHSWILLLSFFIVVSVAYHCMLPHYLFTSF